MKSRELFDLARDSISGSPEKRETKRVRTFGTLEVETKVEITSPSQVTEMIQRIRAEAGGISKGKCREQLHTVFAEGSDEYHGVVLVPGKNDVQVRTKERGALILSPKDSVPVFLRRERKVGPEDPNYVPYLHKVWRGEKLGSFSKHAVDASFWVDSLSFTATVSLVDDPEERGTDDHCYQLELEYDGHKQGTDPPSDAEVLLGLERGARIAFGDAPYTTRTKLDWLVEKSALAPWSPRYEPYAGNVAELLSTERV